MSKEDAGITSGVNGTLSGSDQDSDNGTVFEEDDEEDFKLVNHAEVHKVLLRFYELKLMYFILHGQTICVYDNPPHILSRGSLTANEHQQLMADASDVYILWSKNGLVD